MSGNPSALELADRRREAEQITFQQRRTRRRPRRQSPPDGYLICTDGLTDPLPNDVLDGLLREYDDGRAAFELWKAAIAAGGTDNITLALVRIADQ